MAQYMGVSEDSYELIEWYFLDGRVVVENDWVIENKDELVNYLVEKSL